MPENNVPQIPSIIQPPGSGNADQLSAMLDQVSKSSQVPLPEQYVPQTQIAEPRIKNIQPTQMVPTNNQPMTNQATSVRQARTQNSFGQLANMIGQASNRFVQQKQDNLKEDLKTVMQSKQNIANAQSILQQDPNNELAKQVLARNKQQLEGILNDPKKTKALQKAFEVSFTDPSKNKKPEVQAMQQAMAEHKTAGAFNSSNPAEYAVAQQAQRTNELGGQLPAQPQVNVQQAQPNVAATPQQAFSSAASSTPRADTLLSKDQEGIAVNPQYSEALKQKEKMQQVLHQYIIPRMITGEMNRQVQAARDVNSNARANLKAASDFQVQQMKAISAANLQNQKAKDALTLQARRDAQNMARTKYRVDAMVKVAEDNRIDKDTREGILHGASGLLTKEIHATVADGKILQDRLDKEMLLRDNIGDKDPNALDHANQTIQSIETAMKYNSAKLQFQNEQAAKTLGIIDKQLTSDTPKKDEKPEDTIFNSLYHSLHPNEFNKGTTNAKSDSSAGTSKFDSSNILAIGAGESDEDSNTDSDTFGDSEDDDQ